MEKRLIPVVTAIIEDGKKYLLLKRSKINRTSKNKWQFPEGKIEFGEDPVDALKRELEEETGLELISAEFLNYSSSVVDFPNLGSTHLIRLFFKCDVKGNVKLSEEHTDWNFFGIDEIEKLDIMKDLDLKDIKKIGDKILRNLKK